jgi:hypothetical protein
MPVEDASDLYGLALDEFVAERTALAKALRACGEREEAARVAKLPKPSVAAWTVNQLVRTQDRAIEVLFAAGDALTDAQSELLAGSGDAGTLREAARRERDSRGRLVDIARGFLSSDGHEPAAATLERVSDALHAAAVDPDARSQLRGGCLVRELRHVGIGGEAPVAADERPARRSDSRPPPPSPSTGGAGRSRSAARTKAERESRDEERRLVAERARELKLARRAVAGADQHQRRAARELQAARARMDRARESLRAAEGEVAAAQARADDAALELRSAKDALDAI